MSQKYTALLALVLLAACGGNPLEPAPPTPPAPPPVPPVTDIGEEVEEPVSVEVPAIIAQHVRGAAYNAANQQLTINLGSLDGTPIAAEYNRDVPLDLSGYEAYTLQDANTQRKFLALVKTSASGAVTATAVADGGQFGTYFGGGTYYRADTFTLPTSGLASYTGSYVGVLNRGAIVPGGLGGGLDSRQSDRVTGRILINADFNETNLEVNGGVDNRSVVESGFVLENIQLWPATINEDGGFAGQVYNTGGNSIGNFGGLFAGPQASDVAGVLVLRPIQGDAATIEHGVFVLPRCTGPSANNCP